MDGRMRERRQWIVGDPTGGLPLDQIKCRSIRAHSLIARSDASPAVTAGFLDLHGAAEMLAGLEYHHENFVRIYSSVEDPWSAFVPPLQHEAIAYLNRMAQFHAFARSKFVGKYVKGVRALMPNIERFRYFRDNHAAHRSLDALKGDATDAAVNHAMSLSTTGGLNLIPRPGDWLPPKTDGLSLEREHYEMRMHRHRSSYVAFTIHNADIGIDIEFCMERDHPAIADEAYGLIEAVISYCEPMV